MVGKSCLDVQMFTPFLIDFDPELKDLRRLHHKQEDAHEFLEFLLNRVHDELVSYEKIFSQDFETTESPGLEVEEWTRQRKKGKGAASVVKMNLARSALSSSFISQVRHTRYQIGRGKGGRKTVLSATTQPYFVLPLDIRYSDCVEDALDIFLSRGEVQGYVSSSHRGLDVVETLQMETLPEVLVLQLKRFWFNEEHGNCEKIGHKCTFKSHLTLFPSMLVGPQGADQSKYDLVSVVAHHGQAAFKGHYTCAARHGTGWVHLDDSSVSPISEMAVTQLPAYLLFYQRCPHNKS
mmetsp:Transcript_6903/g.9256  ORF Transcript_6903/g.9256 Transcript_6903/m.9256 type:complete len:293 (-) Transcript_6903:21-899(-)